MTCPTGKVSHPTYESALAHQKKLVYKNHISGEPERSKGLNVYPCDLCIGWHVGHSDPSIPMVYHYTIGRYLGKILDTGVLRPRKQRESLAINEPNPLLWFSRNAVWEPSVLKDPRPLDKRVPPTGRAVTELAGQGLLRFGAMPSVAKLRWSDYLNRNETPAIQREAMCLRGDPVDWLATDQEVLVSDCRSFEVWYNGAWTDGGTLADGAFEAYLAGRMKTYKEAWKRIQSKVKAGARYDQMTVLDDAEAILVEDCKIEERESEWVRTHQDEIRKFSASLPRRTRRPLKRKRRK